MTQIFPFDLNITLFLLFGTCLVPLFLFYRSFVSSYSMFRCHSWFLNFRLMYNIITENGIGDQPLMNFIFQKCQDVCKENLQEGMCVVYKPNPYLVLYGGELLKVLVNEPLTVDKPNIYKVLDLLGKNGLFISNGNTWRKQKKMIAPAFYPRMLKDMEPIMERRVQVFVQQLSELEGKTCCNIHELLDIYSWGCFFESTLGIKSNGLENSDKLTTLTKNIAIFLEFAIFRAFNPLLYWDFALKFSPYGRRMIKLADETHNIVEKLVEALKESVLSGKMAKNADEDFADNHQHKKSMGEVLIEEQLADPSITMKDLTSQFITLMIAGSDTLSSAMQFCLFLLGLHQDVQEKVYNEIMSFGDDIQFSDLNDMTYTECAIKEALRLFPTGPMFLRRLKKDVCYGKYKVPKDTNLVFFTYMLHRNPNIYPDPETFNPDRFLGNNKSDIKPWNYLPFAESARPCIGKNYAMMELKIVVAHVLRNFKIVSVDRMEDILVSFELVLKTIKPIRMQFLSRST